MNLKKFLMVVVSTSLVLCGFARDWYVDANAGSDVTGDGTASKPYETILMASTNVSLAANETIYVAEGVYSNGWREVSGLKTRVYCSKAIRFKAIGRKAFTHIVGAWDPEGDEHGRGANAIRCAATTAATWEGFTFRDGSTLTGSDDTNNSPNIGGGVLGGTVVDCVISNCCAYKGGGSRQAKIVRTLIVNCWSSGGGDAANGGSAYFCVFANNHGVSATSSVASYNCTYVGNASSTAYAGATAAYNCLFSGNVGGIDTRSDATGSVNTKIASFPLMAPVFGDYRIVAGSLAAGCADRSKFSATYTTDFSGNEIPATGDLNVGAIAVGTITPAAGCVYVDCAASFEGAPLMTDNASWAYPESYPTQFCVKPFAAGKHIMRITSSQTDGTCLYPTMKDEFFLTPHPTVATTNTVTWASKVYYVDPHEGVGDDNANSGTEPTSPFQTIEKAMSLGGKAVSVIYCAAGDYTKGGRTLEAQQIRSVTNIVCCDASDYNVFVRGKGAGVSFITGAPDPTTGGRGTCATRSVGLFSVNVALQGFTLRNGYGDTSSGASGNGIYMRTNTDGSRSQILDCEITGHVGQMLANAGQFVRCRIAGNTAAANLIKAVLESCLVADNDFATASSMVSGGKLYASTIVGASLNTTLFAASGVSAYGCVLSKLNYPNANNTYRGVIAGDVKYPESGSPDVVYDDPLFVNEDNMDYRLMNDTPAKNVEFASSDWTDAVRFRLGPDINGVRRMITATGFLPGAYVQTVGSYFSISGKGVLMNGVEPNGRYTLDDGESVVITRDESKETVAVGVEVNGKAYRFAETPAVTVSAADIKAAGGVLTVRVVEATEWYVSEKTGDDMTGVGFDPKYPFKTFARVLTNANLKAGHTVHVAEGLYNADKMPDGQLFARAVIPAGVTMVADGAAENTVIEGADAPNADARGLGVGAVRCVRFGGINSAIRGFTLRGGRTMPPSATETNAEKTGDNYTGGGVRGFGTANAQSMLVENCILTDCAANRGGAAACCTLKNCRVTANVGVNRGAAGLYVYAYGCLFDNHATKLDVLMYPYSVVNCTFGPGNDSTLLAATFSSGTWEFVNNIVFCSVSMGTTMALNSVFTLTKHRDATYLGDGCIVTNAEALCLTDDLRPTIDSELLVDRGGDFVALSNLTDKDASGEQRIYNGTVDIGALEYDWRGQFARRLRPRSRRGFVVESASSGIQAATDAITMTDGEMLKVDWTVDEAVPAGFKAAVVGEGTISVNVNGSAVPVSGGVCNFKLIAGANVIEIAFKGEGEAAVSDFFGAEHGLMLIVR